MTKGRLGNGGKILLHVMIWGLHLTGVIWDERTIRGDSRVLLNGLGVSCARVENRWLRRHTGIHFGS
jgi:hypothetical protein